MEAIFSLIVHFGWKFSSVFMPFVFESTPSHNPKFSLFRFHYKFTILAIFIIPQEKMLQYFPSTNFNFVGF